MGDGAGSSQATQPAESQVIDPTQVDYLNYQEHKHDATDGGYDEQHIVDGGGVHNGEGEDDIVLVLDEADIAAATTP